MQRFSELYTADVYHDVSLRVCEKVNQKKHTITDETTNVANEKAVQSWRENPISKVFAV